MPRKNANSVALDTQLAGERKLFLGKLNDDDAIPGSTVTVGEAKASYEKSQKAFETKKFERRQRILNQTARPVQTSVVTHGIVTDVELHRTETVLTDVTEDLISDKNGLLPLPSEEELEAMQVKDLITLAGNRKVEVKANVDTKPVLIQKLRGTYVEPETTTAAKTDNAEEGKTAKTPEEKAKK